METTVIFGVGPFTEGAQYTGSNGVVYVYKNGCFVIPAPEDIDTVDGYSEQAVSDGTQLDANGEAIPAGSPIINFYDAEGNLVNSKDCTKTVDSFAVLAVAEADGLDAAGNLVAAGDPVVKLPDGSEVCVKKPLPEVQIGGVMPESDSGVKLWVDNGVVKYPGTSGWIQNTPFGA